MSFQQLFELVEKEKQTNADIAEGKEFIEQIMKRMREIDWAKRLYSNACNKATEQGVVTYYICPKLQHRIEKCEVDILEVAKILRNMIISSDNLMFNYPPEAVKPHFLLNKSYRAKILLKNN